MLVKSKSKFFEVNARLLNRTVCRLTSPPQHHWRSVLVKMHPVPFIPYWHTPEGVLIPETLAPLPEDKLSVLFYRQDIHRNLEEALGEIRQGNVVDIQRHLSIVTKRLVTAEEVRKPNQLRSGIGGTAFDFSQSSVPPCPAYSPYPASCATSSTAKSSMARRSTCQYEDASSHRRQSHTCTSTTTVQMLEGKHA